MREFATMKLALRLAVPLLLTMAGCQILPPYETIPPPLKANEPNPGPRVAVCYNAFTTSTEAVRAVAAEGCGPGTTPQPLEHHICLNACPLLEPERRVFVCAKTEEPKHEHP
ncbi:MAG TPA: hypothetical protein VET85_04700 [Stellaceae bacterium]|nr:hypothetical protein [Stellaceae bacterium]